MPIMLSWAAAKVMAAVPRKPRRRGSILSDILISPIAVYEPSFAYCDIRVFSQVSKVLHAAKRSPRRAEFAQRASGRSHANERIKAFPREIRRVRCQGAGRLGDQYCFGDCLKVRPEVD